MHENGTTRVTRLLLLVIACLLRAPAVTGMLTANFSSRLTYNFHFSRRMQIYSTACKTSTPTYCSVVWHIVARCNDTDVQYRIRCERSFA